MSIVQLTGVERVYHEKGPCGEPQKIAELTPNPAARRQNEGTNVPEYLGLILEYHCLKGDTRFALNSRSPETGRATPAVRER